MVGDCYVVGLPLEGLVLLLARPDPGFLLVFLGPGDWRLAQDFGRNGKLSEHVRTYGVDVGVCIFDMLVNGVVVAQVSFKSCGYGLVALGGFESPALRLFGGWSAFDVAVVTEIGPCCLAPIGSLFGATTAGPPGGGVVFVVVSGVVVLGVGVGVGRHGVAHVLKLWMGGAVTLVGGVDEPDKHFCEVVDFGCVVGLFLLEGRCTFCSAVLEPAMLL